MRAGRQAQQHCRAPEAFLTSPHVDENANWTMRAAATVALLPTLTTWRAMAATTRRDACRPGACSSIPSDCHYPGLRSTSKTDARCIGIIRVCQEGQHRRMRGVLRKERDGTSHPPLRVLVQPKQSLWCERPADLLAARRGGSVQCARVWQSPYASAPAASTPKPGGALCAARAVAIACLAHPTRGLPINA